ncbi:MAG TPA: hypothetical protein VFX89_17870 [Gammaproteobacteria bacterium]|nr:hypothetical protein [Gammaproteobacteria bacterium]
MTHAAKKDLERRQRRWAESAGVAFDARGYVREESANFRVPLSDGARLGLDRGSERKPYATRPARTWALHSSAALVANVFDHWTGRDLRPLLRALGRAEERAELAFEEPLVTGLEGDAPAADVALRLEGGGLLAIESKFSEWLVRRPRNKAEFKAKYFPGRDRLWEARALPRCQALAADIQSGARRFKWLHAAQLLKHALGLATSAPGAGALCYLYYDWPTREGRAHRAEVDAFAAALDTSLPFAALSYQSLFGALSAEPSVDRAYLDYLRARYFSSAAAAPPP